MQKLSMIESATNMMDFGIFMEVIKHAVKNRMEMRPEKFIKHLIFGKGYRELSPVQLSDEINKQKTPPLIIDLRGKDKFKKGHIHGSVLHSFDDFLRQILIDDGYRAHRNRSVVLVCDTGQKSKVAASVLADEGFLKVFSLNRGMRRWNRWQKLMSLCRQNREKRFHICSLIANREK